MKNIFKLITLCVAVAFFNSCEEDLIIYGETQFVQLDTSAGASLTENSGGTVVLTAILGAPQSGPTTVNFDVTGGDASRYTLTPGASITIPAGETSGTVTFAPVDNDAIDGDVDVTLTLSGSSSVPVGVGGEGLQNVSRTITIVDDNVPCNDYNVNVITDSWGCETSWQITDSTGAVVASDGPLSPCTSSGSEEFNVPVTLEDGCYTFTIFDSYGDGMTSGSYAVTCGALVAASGGGNLADGNSSESTDFCVNQ